MTKTRRQYAIGVVAGYTDPSTAELIIERLSDEGLLHLGYGRAEVDQIVDAFRAEMGTTKVSQNDRFAANRLADKFGAQSVVYAIKAIAPGGQYVPVVNNISQLEDKWVSVMNYVRSKVQEQNDTIDV